MPYPSDFRADAPGSPYAHTMSQAAADCCDALGSVDGTNAKIGRIIDNMQAMDDDDRTADDAAVLVQVEQLLNAAHVLLMGIDR